MDPTTALMLAQIGSSYAGGKMAPEGQQMQSFAGSTTDPRKMLEQANWKTQDFERLMQPFLQSPISLPSAYVQQPGSFGGPSLPMTFGLSGSDPALGNPDLLSRQSPFSFGPGQTGQPQGFNQPGGDPPSRFDDPNEEAIRALKLLGFGRGRNPIAGTETGTDWAIPYF